MSTTQSPPAVALPELWRQDALDLHRMGAYSCCVGTYSECAVALEAALRAQPVASGDVVDRDAGGRVVREAWVRWAQTQPNPKPSWLVPYDDLSESDKEADRQIYEACRLAQPSALRDSATTVEGWVLVPRVPTKEMIAADFAKGLTP